jgi:hypothetical protein
MQELFRLKRIVLENHLTQGNMLKAMISFRNYRWAARLTGFLGLVLIMSFMLGKGFAMLKDAQASYDLLFLLTLFSFSFFAYVIGWIIELVGGVLLLLSGMAIAFYVYFSPVFGGLGYVLLISLPFIIPGILFMFSWKHKIERTRNVVTF